MGLSGRGGREGKVRSSQVCTPGHHPPACLGALGTNFLSRKLTFSSCEKQKEEKCVNTEKSRSGRGSSCPSQGSRCRFPGAGIALRDGHKPSTGMTKDSSPNPASTHYCTCHEQTLLLPRANPAPATAPPMVFPQTALEVQHCA